MNPSSQGRLKIYITDKIPDLTGFYKKNNQRDYLFYQGSKSIFPNPYYFTSRRFDTETCLYYYRARIYNPYIGRFLQTDSIGYYDGMNLYVYVGNNPIMLIDPWGLCRRARYDGNSFKERFWEGIDKVAGVLLIAKEVSDIIEVKAGLAPLGLEIEPQVGPVKVKIGVSTGDAITVSNSRTTIISEMSIADNLKAGNWTFGPSLSIIEDRFEQDIRKRVRVETTPFAGKHKSGIEGEPWKISAEGHVAFFKGQIGINLTEVVDLYEKIAGKDTND